MDGMRGESLKETLNSEDDGIPEYRSHKEETSKKTGDIIWRVVNGLMTVFFLMATGVQFNDPDPYLWVPIYGIAAVLTCCVSVKPVLTEKKWWRIPYAIHAIYIVGMFIYVMVQFVMAVRNPESDGTINPLTYEEGRELSGLLITGGWLFVCRQSPSIRCGVPSWLRNVCCSREKSLTSKPAFVTSAA